MTHFTVEAVEPMTLESAPPLSEMYTLSPWVWREGPRYGLLIRAVPRRDEMPAEKVSRIYDGWSDDGLRFRMGDRPVIAPGPEPEDQDGCEDPTLASVDGRHYVYYSGWSETTRRGELLLAEGPDTQHLQKRGIILPATTHRANPKEATIAPVADGTWRLFFEYADADASRIGLASAPRVDGPWTVGPPPLAAGPGAWDNWHLSTGPVLTADPQRPVLLYNGATRDAHWRIGWAAFDAGYTRVVARSEEPLIMPSDLAPGYTDIAFAASAVELADGRVFLYYSIADRDLFRATLRRA